MNERQTAILASLHEASQKVKDASFSIGEYRGAIAKPDDGPPPGEDNPLELAIRALHETGMATDAMMRVVDDGDQRSGAFHDLENVIYRFRWPTGVSSPPNLTWFIETITDDPDTARHRITVTLWRFRAGAERYKALYRVAPLDIEPFNCSVGELLEMFYPTWSEVRDYAYSVAVSRGFVDEIMANQANWTTGERASADSDNWPIPHGLRDLIVGHSAGHLGDWLYIVGHPVGERGMGSVWRFRKSAIPFGRRNQVKLLVMNPDDYPWEGFNADGMAFLRTSDVPIQMHGAEPMTIRELCRLRISRSRQIREIDIPVE